MYRRRVVEGVNGRLGLVEVGVDEVECVVGNGREGIKGVVGLVERG